MRIVTMKSIHWSNHRRVPSVDDMSTTTHTPTHPISANPTERLLSTSVLVIGTGGAGLRVSGGALRALALDQCPEPSQLAELRRVMRVTVRHLAGGDLNAWKLGSGLRTGA